MPAFHPKLILNMLSGAHSLHPKLVHNACVVTIFSTPNWFHLYMLVSFRPKVILNPWHAFPSLQTETTYIVSTFLHPKLMPIYTCLLPSAPKWDWTCFLARIPFTHLSPQTDTRSLCSQYFPPPQTGAHLYMLASHPKLILNMLSGAHSLHPKLVHEAYVVSTFLHPKLVPIYTCLLPSAPNWYWTCFLPSPQTSTRSLCMPM